MKNKFQMLSVLDIAEICNVARSTVSYWIAKKKLPATRIGKKDRVAVEDLVMFLRSEGKIIPSVLLTEVANAYSQPFKPFKKCWEYWVSDPVRHEKCMQCPVFTNQINECFAAQNNAKGEAHQNCHTCDYYLEYYGLRIAFLHQLKKPAAVFKDLVIWAGNKLWAELCQMETEQLIGKGFEEILHQDSLGLFINYNKRKQQGDRTVSDWYNISFVRPEQDRIDVFLHLIPLVSPAGASLAVITTTY